MSAEPVSKLIQHGAVRLRHSRTQQGRRSHQDLGRSTGWWMEAEAEVAVRHSAGSRASPKALAPSCATGPLLLLMDRCGTRLPGLMRPLALQSLGCWTDGWRPLEPWR